MIGMITTVFFILFCQFGLSMQNCQECLCCINGTHSCDISNHCNDGCIDGFHGGKCTQMCMENCKRCTNARECTECQPGNYTALCNVPCGKGCLNKTCSIDGHCDCESINFNSGFCNTCSGNTYSDECKSCPSNCGACESDDYCRWCKNTVFYGNICQNRCSIGCKGGTCNKASGICNTGCKFGYGGEKCDTCSPGFYGNFCDLKCTENCSVCNSMSNCTECKLGFFGETCTYSCPPGCNGNCSHYDGQCFECNESYAGDFCDICKAGRYGNNCSFLCRNKDKNCEVCIANEKGVYNGCKKCHSGYYPVIPNGYGYSICNGCSNYCIDHVCNMSGFCKKGCKRGKWGEMCQSDCKTSCVECDQNNGTCLECTNETFSDDCSKNCSTNCNNTGNDRMCSRDTGKCVQGCISMTKYGEYCKKQCSETCNNESCDWKSGHCSDGCNIDYHGLFCDKKCSTSCLSNGSKRVCDENMGHCLYGCIDGFHGSRCDSKCSSQCFNITCNQVTAECLYGCTDGYEGLQCVMAIKGAESDEKKSLVVIAGSAGAGGTAIVLLVILVICLIKRNRRQKLSSNTKRDENDYALDMKEIPKQIDGDEPGVIYAKPFKPKQEAGGDAGKEYDTAYDSDQKIPAIDNGYTAVNIETSANEKNKSFEVCDNEHDNKCNKPLSGNNNYAVVNKAKSSGNKNECIEEVYDTTHDNKKNKQPLNSNNDYAVLSVRFDNTKGFGKSNLAQPDDVYDSAEAGNHKTMPRPSNDYAVFNCNIGDKHENTLYDTKSDKKMRPVNNDYDFCELDSH